MGLFDTFWVDAKCATCGHEWQADVQTKSGPCCMYDFEVGDIADGFGEEVESDYAGCPVCFPGIAYSWENKVPVTLYFIEGIFVGTKSIGEDTYQVVRTLRDAVAIQEGKRAAAEKLLSRISTTIERWFKRDEVAEGGLAALLGLFNEPLETPPEMAAEELLAALAELLDGSDNDSEADKED